VAETIFALPSSCTTLSLM